LINFHYPGIYKIAVKNIPELIYPWMLQFGEQYSSLANYEQDDLCFLELEIQNKEELLEIVNSLQSLLLKPMFIEPLILRE